MVLPKKAKEVADLKETLEKSPLSVVTDYRGLTVSEISHFRGQLRPVGAKYKVAKNTLTGIAAREIGMGDLSRLLEGPTAIAFSGTDYAGMAKVVSDYAKTSKVFKVKGGVLQGKVLSPDQISAIADLPPRDVLVAKALETMQAPIVGLVSVMNATVASIVRVLDARRQQLEAGV